MLDLHHLPGSELEEKHTLVFRRHPLTLLPLILSMMTVAEVTAPALEKTALRLSEVVL